MAWNDRTTCCTGIRLAARRNAEPGRVNFMNMHPKTETPARDSTGPYGASIGHTSPRLYSARREA